MSAEFQSIAKKVSEIQTMLYEENSDFNEYYDEVNDVQLDGILPIEILYKCDPNEYDEILNEWRQEIFEEEFNLTIILLNDALIKNRVRPLIKALKKNKVAPFVGAGLSIPCGKKSWPAMLLDIGKRLSLNVEQNVFEKLIEDGHYIEAADAIAQSSPEQLNEYIKSSLSDSKPIGGSNITS